jgi:hypothetical protein
MVCGDNCDWWLGFGGKEKVVPLHLEQSSTNQRAIWGGGGTVPFLSDVEDESFLDRVDKNAFFFQVIGYYSH